MNFRGWPKSSRWLLEFDFANLFDGDPDPISAGTAGEAALWGGSIAVVGMAATPFGAH